MTLKRLVRNEFHTRRKRRSLSEGPKVEISFSVADRNFELVLHGDDSVFHEDYEVEDNQGHSLLHRIDHLVSGKIKNQAGSHCYGQLRNGVFSGTIFRHVVTCLEISSFKISFEII